MKKQKEFYKNRISYFTKKKESYKRKLRLISVLRLMLFISIILVFVTVSGYSARLAIAAGILLLIAFGIFIKWFIILQEKYNHTEKLNVFNKNELLALDHVYSVFEDGKEFVNINHEYSYDLDIFGEGSLFQYLNRTCTIFGKEKLAVLLSVLIKEKTEILNRQMAVKELSNDLNLIQNFNATGSAIDESKKDISPIFKWLNEKTVFYNKKGLTVIRYLLPGLFILSVLITIFNPAFYSLIIIAFLLQLMITGLYAKNINSIHSRVSKHHEILQNCSKLLNYIESKDYNSAFLSNLKEGLLTNNHPATQSIKKLSKIIASLDVRLNVIAGILLNGIILWDLQQVIRLEKWKSVHHKKIDEWVNVLGEFDALLSIANFYFNNKSYAFPVFTDDTIISSKDLGHPLIFVNERVSNDFEISEQGEFIIITGANMAGKSTFLRTVGMNFILAMIGAPVCASMFTCCVIPLFTSMRTSDSLQKNESYFYAELKRLKRIIEKLRNGEKPFIILDEILKGTNSKDKQEGSKAVLDQIIKMNGTGIIATHDLDLAKMEKEYPEKISNKCFEIEIENAQIFFDYKLYNGITKNMNASLLIRQMGIIRE